MKKILALTFFVFCFLPSIKTVQEDPETSNIKRFTCFKQIEQSLLFKQIWNPLICPNCSKEFISEIVAILQCGHAFHMNCIKQEIDICPICELEIQEVYLINLREFLKLKDLFE